MCENVLPAPTAADQQQFSMQTLRLIGCTVMEFRMRLLFVEHNAEDSDRIAAELRRFGFEFEYRRVESAAELIRALDEGGWTAVIADCAIPDFSGLEVLRIVRDRSRELPFISVSATMEEERVVEIVHAGASDHVAKDRLGRLPLALERELRDVQLREERRNLFEALRRSEDRYRRMFANAPIGIGVSTARGQLLNANERLAAIMGMPREEIVRRDVSELGFVLPPAISSSSSFETVHTRPDGTLMTASVTVAPIVDDAGAVEQLVWLVDDVTEARSAQERLRLQARLLDAVEQAVIATDRDGVVTYWNRFAEVVCGMSAADAVGRRSFSLTRIEQLRGTVRAAIERLAAGESWSGEILLRLRDGERSPGWAIATPLLDPVGGVRGAVVTFTDITERKKLEGRLQQATRLSSLGRLAATIAHEFNNVLMGISPFVEVIRRGRNVEASLDHIARSVTRGKRITEDILRFTQPAQPVRSPFDLAPWLENITAEARSLMPEQCRVRQTLQPRTLRVNGDANQLQQIFTNMILNARDAMPDGGTLTIEARREAAGSRFSFGVLPNPERYAHVIVSDTGKGMAPEILSHIYEPLFTTKKTGTGLGLSVAHQVVQQHGGEIFVESAPGAGTTFHVFLPLDPSTPAEHEDSGAAAPVTGRHVLLVEDDAVVASGLVSLLEFEGFDVALAVTGQDALEAVERATPDVVVLDVGLPDIEGTTVYEQIAANRPDLPVVFSTGHSGRAKIERLLQRPNVAYLLKPYDAASLLDAIRNVTR